MVRTGVFSRFLGLSLAFFILQVTLTRGAEPSQSQPLVLSVDATEAPRKLLHARLVIPAPPGPLTL